MTEKLIVASALKATFIHKLDNPERQKGWEWLDGLLSSGNQNQIPPIVAAKNPETEEYLIYDGNIRLAHGLQNGYLLRTLTIENQNDLDEYLSKNPACWFGIRDFPTLLKFMRLYVKNPQEGSKIDSELAEFLQQKERGRIARLQAEATKAYGWYSDE